MNKNDGTLQTAGIKRGKAFHCTSYNLWYKERIQKI